MTTRSTIRTPAAAPGSILVVDDHAPSVAVLRCALEGARREPVVVRSTTDDAREWLDGNRPEFMIVASTLADDSGLELLAHVRETVPVGDHVPTAVIADPPTPAVVRHALELGAGQVVRRPLATDELVLHVSNQIDVGATVAAAANLTRVLRRGLAESEAERARCEEVAAREHLALLGHVATMHSPSTSTHMRRVGDLAARLVAAAGLGEMVEQVRVGGALHDVGKIGVPHALLDEPGPLSAAQRAVVETHARLGAQLLGHAHHPLIAFARTVALTHHERWDGAGYPLGLAGERIPLGGRAVAVADVFDALVDERPYKHAWPVDRAVAELVSVRGTHLDPELVDVFVAHCVDATSTGVGVRARSTAEARDGQASNR